MVKTRDPGQVPLVGATAYRGPSADANDFGAQVGQAGQQLGRAISGFGDKLAAFEKQRQGAEDKAFLDRAELELDLDYARISFDEQGKVKDGAERYTQTLYDRFDKETPGIIDRVRNEHGYRPSADAIKEVERRSFGRRSGYLKRAIVYENNERVRHLQGQFMNTVSVVAETAAKNRDLGGAIQRLEQSLAAYSDVMAPHEQQAARETASQAILERFQAEMDPVEFEQMADQVIEDFVAPGRRFERDNPETRGLTKDAAPAKAKTAPKDDAIGQAAMATGISDDVLRVFAKIESGGNPNARTGSYKGLFQLSDHEFNKHGGGDIYDPTDNAMAAAKKLQREAATFQAKHGRAPTTTDLYLVHQQGEAGYDAHLRNPEAPAWQNMASTGEGRQKGERWSKLAIWGNIPNDMKRKFGSVENVTSADFIKVWDEKVKRFGGKGEVVSETDNSLQGSLARQLIEKRGAIGKAAEVARVKMEKAAAEEAERVELRQRLDGIVGGSIIVDPASKDDKDLIDSAFSAADGPRMLGEGSTQAVATLTALTKQTGIVPESATSQLRAMSVNGNPEQQVFAYETAANLMREKPGAFDNTDKAKRLKDDAEMYQTLTVEMGVPMEQALARIGELRSPEFEKRREAVKKDAESFMKEVTGDELVQDYAGWFTSAPELGGSPRRAGVVADTYRELVKEHYIRTGDKEVARSMAKKDLKRVYNVSEVTGKKRLMRHPPEMHYPAIEPRAGKDPDHSYFTDQLVESVKSRSGKDIPIENIFIEAVPQTNMDIRSGNAPGYGVVWLVERDGVPVMESYPGMVFRGDVKAAREREMKNREDRLRYSRQKEIDRQQAKENDPARKAAKAIVKGIKDRVLNPDTATGDFPELPSAP